MLFTHWIVFWGYRRPGSCIPPPTSYHKLSLSPVVACINITINVSQTCRNLGVMLDCNMTMSHEICSICISVRYQLRNIGFIRKYLTRSATENWFVLISSRLDFGNALLFNLPQTQLSRLQKLQNAAARISTLSKKYTHITPILQSLHWLQVRDRIGVNILLLVFHCLKGFAAHYIYV